MELKDLYMCDIEISNGFRPVDEEYEENIRNMEIKKNHLLETMSQEQAKLFEDFIESYIKVSGQEELELYKRAFASGMKVATEALLLGTNC